MFECSNLLNWDHRSQGIFPVLLIQPFIVILFFYCWLINKMIADDPPMFSDNTFESIPHKWHFDKTVSLIFLTEVYLVRWCKKWYCKNVCWSFTMGSFSLIHLLDTETGFLFAWEFLCAMQDNSKINIEEIIESAFRFGKVTPKIFSTFFWH